MAFAPHTNVDVKIKKRHFGTSDLPVVLGAFRSKDSDVLFEFSPRTGFVPEFASEFTHMIYVEGGHRLAKVLKTVAYVVTDEDDFGNPVVEKWDIKNYKEYDYSWVG